MNSLTSIISNFEPPLQVSSSTLRPLLAHAVIEGISGKIIQNYLTERGVIISASSVNTWRREAAVWLGFTKPKAGRVSALEQQKIRASWHAANGHPTLQNLVDGWEPGQPIPSVEKTTKPQVTKSGNDEKRQSKKSSIPPLKPSQKLSEEDLLNQLTKPT